jgi:CRP-like cAMP-binding protein
MDLGYGEVFGEDFICFGLPNTYAIKAESTKVTLLSIDKSEYNKKYKRMT